MTEIITDTVDTTTPNNSSSDDNKQVEKKRSRMFRRNPINEQIYILYILYNINFERKDKK